MNQYQHDILRRNAKWITEVLRACGIDSSARFVLDRITAASGAGQRLVMQPTVLLWTFIP